MPLNPESFDSSGKGTQIPSNQLPFKQIKESLTIDGLGYLQSGGVETALFVFKLLGLVSGFAIE